VSDRFVLDAQRSQWERALTERADRFGVEPSAPAREAATLFEREGMRRLLELGGGQGRDSLSFARRGFEVQVLDYAAAGVEAIARKANEHGLGGRVSARQFDVRQPLPFAEDSFDGCFSHMLFCMALTLAELDALSTEVRRVLRPGGLHIYTARTTDDPDCGKGIHHGEGLYEQGGFIVHFFDEQTIDRLADGYDLVGVARFEEGPLPRRLMRVTLRKPVGGRLSNTAGVPRS
jgi:SAM-dependent methyltransferase